VPARFGPYTIHDELGAGGMASVHLADWPTAEGTRRVALKRLFPHVANDPEMIASFIDEARLARYLRHPNIAQVYEFGRISGVHFIAFEFVHGPTVQQLARQCAAHVGPIPVSVVLSIASQLCDALDHAHNQCDEDGLPLGIVHRDVSPQNLIVSNTGIVKLIDFGLAKAKYSSVDSHIGIIKGKLNYVAPEYLQGRLDIRCDLWSGGVVLHELLTGRKLFEADDNNETLERVRSMPIPPPSRFNAEVSPDLDQIVLTALQRDPGRRWQTAGSLRHALAAYSTRHRELTRAQLVTWVEWAFSQKQKLREDSGVSALHEIVSSPAIIETNERDDADITARKLPAISAAMEERRRESMSLSSYVGEAMLRRQRDRRVPVWLVASATVVAALVAWLIVRLVT
jgi:serine/threonine protein kinase